LTAHWEDSTLNNQNSWLMFAAGNQNKKRALMPAGINNLSS